MSNILEFPDVGLLGPIPEIEKLGRNSYAAKLPGLCWFAQSATEAHTAWKVWARAQHAARVSVLHMNNVVAMTSRGA